ncbi:MAG: Na+/H+ antiporter [Sciscionella sp.]
MHPVEILLLLVGSLAVTIIARKLGWQPSLVLVALGLAVSFIPAVPVIEPDPEVILVLVLPPLLYSAALNSSYVNIRANLRPIGLLAVGLVLATTVAVGFLAHAVVPGLPLPAALVLGAVVAPPDAVAAVSIGRTLGLPRRVMTLLAGESLGNDATALTAYKVAVAAATGAALSWGSSVEVFALAAAGGVIIGLALGMIVHAVRQRLGNSTLESALGMLVPFGTYLLAESIGASGVLAVVVAGLYLGHNGPKAGFATRLQESAVWRAIDVLLESVVFALIGLQLRAVVIDGHASLAIVVPAVVILAATIAIRFAWIFPATYLPRWLSHRIREREPTPGWRGPAVLAWAGMRGVVSLAAAAAVPLAMTGRDTVLLLTFVVTVGTLLLHGTTLPWVIRKLGLHGDEQRSDALAEAQVQHRAANAALGKLDELVASGDATRTPVVQRLRTLAEYRGNAAWERLGQREQESPAAAFRRLRRTMLGAEREVFVSARDAGEIDDEVLRTVQRELDLEEAALDRD